jgi:DNA-binding CsgD family transcriptional regulator
MVGRDAELARLLSAAERTRGGQVNAVWVVGEAGIGKTRLVEEMTSRLDAADLVLIGHGVDLENGELPYGVAADAGIRIAGQPRSPASTLTPREHEVLEQMATGRTNAQIAADLFMSPKTVSVHISRIIAKLGASNRTEAAALARRQGLLDASEESPG